MKAGNPVEPGTAVRSIAASTLGVSQDAAADDVRATFLRRLAEMEFLPSSEECEAFDLLTGKSTPASHLTRLAERLERERLEADVDEFAGSFFATDLSERKARWEHLNGACARHEPLADRLGELERGLHVVPPELRDEPPEAARLIQHCLELFVLPRRTRVLRRQELLHALRSGTALAMARWSSAVRDVRRRHGAIAALAPEVMDGLSVVRPTRPRRRNHFLPNTADLRFSAALWVLVAVGGGLLGAFSRGFKDLRPIQSPPAVSSPDASVGRFIGMFRSSMKKSLARELTELGQRADESILEAVLTAFPPDQNALLPFYRTEQTVAAARSRDRDRLAAVLRNHGVVLENEQLERLLEKCLNRKYLVSGGRSLVSLPRQLPVREAKRP